MLQTGRCIEPQAVPVRQIVPIGLEFPLAPQQICPALQSCGPRHVIAAWGHDVLLPHIVVAVPEAGRVAQQTCGDTQAGVHADAPPLPPPLLLDPPLLLLLLLLLLEPLPAPLLPPPDPLPLPPPLLELPPPLVPLLDDPLPPAGVPPLELPLAPPPVPLLPPSLLAVGFPPSSPNPVPTAFAQPIGNPTPAHKKNPARAHFMEVALEREVVSNRTPRAPHCQRRSRERGD